MSSAGHNAHFPAGDPHRVTGAGYAALCDCQTGETMLDSFFFLPDQRLGALLE